MPQIPVFEYVPIIGNATANATLKVVTLAGVSTRHGDTGTDSGRLYVTITFGSSLYTVGLYADVARGSDSLVASGTCASLDTYFTLAAANDSGITGRCLVSGYTADETDLVAIPSFAVDPDVLVSQSGCARLPGYDVNYGLGFIQAQAMRQIMAADLPRAVPYLYSGAGLAGFVPGRKGIELVDLTKLANVDQLRVAQASLTKALACQQVEHLVEFAEQAKFARDRYADAMNAVAAANYADVEAEQQVQADNSSLSFGSFRRG